MSNLKPCPFCGGKANLNRLDPVRSSDWYVGCKQCGAWTENQIPEPEIAIEAWNRRTNIFSNLIKWFKR